MTWEELKEETKKMDAEIVVGSIGEYTYEKIIMDKLCFYSDGEITCPYIFINGEGYPEKGIVKVAKNRTPDQMFAIIKALKLRKNGTEMN